MPFLGVGLNREVSGAYAANIKKMNALPGQKVAIDIPSGICSATGRGPRGRHFQPI